jgi:tryptophanyl-tRNA synthetase
MARMKRKRIVSGMRPTGRIHLGHVHGALENWKRLTQDYDCFYFIADWHALTSDYADTRGIRENAHEIIIDWIAVGLDPDIATFFVQSRILEHAELQLLFSMITPLPWLERNPTYKEQLRELTQKDVYTYGFLGYPVLQAADILIYKANGVPVGEDQAPHVELTREIARRFNHVFGEVFPVPDLLLAPTSKLLGLDRRKMSKSYGNAIFLSDNEETVRTKVSQMITDPQRARKSDPGDPSICNVFAFHEFYTDPDTVRQIEEDCRKAEVGCVACKKRMAENLNRALEPIREKRRALEADPDTVRAIMAHGTDKAREVARSTMEEVREKVRI